MTLEEYAAQNPQPQDPSPQQAAPLRTARDRALEREQVETLKDSIAYQLESGAPPQMPLYSALRAIGILTNDSDWSVRLEAVMDGVYADIAQQSLLADEAAIAAQRLDELRTKYNEQIKKQLRGQMAKCDRLQRALQNAYLAATALDDDEPT